jgi:pimeloyl-ACP methyl ester carboxylesterase
MKDLRKIGASICCVVLVGISMQGGFYSFATASDSGDVWELVKDGGSLKLVPELETYWWELKRPPYEPWDKIGLYRVIKSDNEAPIGTFLIFPGTWMNGEQFVSEYVVWKYIEALDASEEKIAELRSMAEDNWISFYLALRGFDVYAMDYRTHFLPDTIEQEDLGFMADWGWKMFVEDAKLAINKVKEVSGADKIFIAGESFGGLMAMNYAAQYWEDDVKGIVLLDGGNGGKIDPSEAVTNMLSPLPAISHGLGLLLSIIPLAFPSICPIFETLLYQVLPLIPLIGMEMYALDLAMDMGLLNPLISLFVKAEKAINQVIDLPIMLLINYIPHYPEVKEYAIEHPLDPPLDPVTGERLEPQYNLVTGERYENYLEWVSGVAYELMMPEMFTNIWNGYNTVEHMGFFCSSLDRYWPIQIYLELIADLMRPGYATDSGVWNRDYFNYYAHYDEIDVPLIAFASGGVGKLFGSFNPGIKNKDVTGYTFPTWGHIEIYFSPHNKEMVNEPTYLWLLERL